MTLKWPRKRYPQGHRTEGSLTFEVRLRFKLRPAGHAGNDSCTFGQSFWALVRLLPIFGLVLMGDEEVGVKEIRWHRPGETWQQWDGGFNERWQEHLAPYDKEIK